jgi:hypothetical protein
LLGDSAQLLQLFPQNGKHGFPDKGEGHPFYLRVFLQVVDGRIQGDAGGPGQCVEDLPDP